MPQPLAFPWTSALRLGASRLMLALALPDIRAADDPGSVRTVIPAAAATLGRDGQ